MTTGVQFTGSLPASATQSYFTFNWNPALQVVWYMMPTTPQASNPEISWEVQVQRTDATHCTYWITVHNLSSTVVNFEGRYAILG